MYDYDLFVIGAGSGGVRAARVAANLGAKVAIAESRYLGGTCVNVGCIPKKLFAYSAEFSDEFELAQSFGWQTQIPEFDWPRLRDNKSREIERLNGVYQRLLEGSGATLFPHHAKILSPHEIQVGNQRLTTNNILIATGAWPWVPDVQGREFAITSNEAFFLDQLPSSIAIVGGGYIAVEFASIFRGLGADTHLLYRGPLFLRGFDHNIRQHLAEVFEHHGIHLHFDTDVEKIRQADNDEYCLELTTGKSLSVAKVMYATGRKPFTDKLGLENTKVRCSENGAVMIDEDYRTSEPNIFAVGDVKGGLELTPIALAEGSAVANTLFGNAKSVDYHAIPTAIFSIPTIATVGLTEEQARQKHSSIRVFESRFKPLRLTLSNVQETVYMKLIVNGSDDKVVGAHMVGNGAGEIIQGIAVAMKAGATKQHFDETLGIHPTAAEEFVTMREVART